MSDAALTVSVRILRQPFNTRPTIEIKVTGGSPEDNRAALRTAAEAAETLAKATA